MKRGTKVSIKRCFLLILTAVFLALNVVSIVSAASGKIILTGATIEEQSATATVETPTIDSNKVTSGITFEKADDYAIIDLEIKNNDALDYSVNSISDNNQNGYIVPINKEAELADAICKVIEDESLRRKMGAYARETSRHFSQENILPLWPKFFKNLVDSTL